MIPPDTKTPHFYRVVVSLLRHLALDDIRNIMLISDTWNKASRWYVEHWLCDQALARYYLLGLLSSRTHDAHFGIMHG